MTARRDFLGFTAGAVAARTVLPLAAQAEILGQDAQVSAHPDAELIAACDAHPALVAAYNQAADRDDLAAEDGPEYAAYKRCNDLICETMPQTMAGAIAKAKAALGEVDAWGGEAQVACTSDPAMWAWDAAMFLAKLQGSAP